jgi:hypothetical protein
MVRTPDVIYGGYGAIRSRICQPQAEKLAGMFRD